jgi:hypothetical protein
MLGSVGIPPGQRRGSLRLDRRFSMTKMLGLSKTWLEIQFSCQWWSTFASDRITQSNNMLSASQFHTGTRRYQDLGRQDAPDPASPLARSKDT